MSILHHFTSTWKIILQDKGAILLLFIASIIYSIIYPLPYHYEQVEAVPVVVADQDHSSSSRALLRLLEASPQIDVTRLADSTDIEQALWYGEAMAIVIIPSDFHQDLLAGRQASIQVASHDGYLLAGSKALAGISQAALTMGGQISLNRQQSTGIANVAAVASLQPLRLENRPLYNTNEGYGSYIVPAVMVLIIQQTLFIGVTLVLGKQAESGRQPTGTNAYLGMLLTFSSIAFINCLYFFLIALRLQSYPQHSSLWSLLLFSLLFSVCVASFALLLSSLLDNRERGLQLLLATAIPMLFLAGYTWPAEALPPLLEKLRWLLPSTAGIQGFVALNQMGAELAILAREVLVLLLLTGSAVAAGLWRYRH